MWPGLLATAVILAVVAVAAAIYFSQTGRGGDAAQATPAPASQPTFTPAPVAAPSSNTPAVVIAPSAPPVATNGETAARDFLQLLAADADLFNPALTTSDAGAAVLDKIYPRLLGQDVQTGEITPTELAERWELSADGLVYTFFLRSDVAWSDGAPVTAADFRFTYAALADEGVQSPYRDRTRNLAQIDAPDPYTLVVTLRTPDCTVLHSLRRPLLPSHRYAPDFSDLASNPLNAVPEVSAGPFRFVAHTPGEQIVLAANPAAWQGAPPMDRWLLRIVPPPAERLRQLNEGLADLAWFTAEELASLDVSGLAPSLTWRRTPAPAFTFLALNQANPAAPQPGRDSAGGLVAQQPHPILGERAVRQAIALGVDAPRLIEQALAGQGYPLAGDVLPAVAWAYAADLAPAAHNVEQAQALLEQAGWQDQDGDGVREKAGAPLALRLTVNAENTARVAAAQLIAQDLAVAGFAVELGPAPFEAVAVELLGQRFDLALAGWDNLAADPGLQSFWNSRDDLPGQGANFTSFQDAEVDAWLEQAQALPGCDLAARGELYRQAQRRVAQELPYVFLSGEMTAWAYSARWAGVDPGPWGLNGNLQEWRHCPIEVLLLKHEDCEPEMTEPTTQKPIMPVPALCDAVDEAEWAALAAAWPQARREHMRLAVDDPFLTGEHQMLVSDGRRAEICYIAYVARPQTGLLLHIKSIYPQGAYRLPTGGVRRGEAVVQTLAREIAEETGLQVGDAADKVQVRALLGVLSYEMAHRSLAMQLSLRHLPLPGRAAGGRDANAAGHGERIAGWRWVAPAELGAVADALEGVGSTVPAWADWGLFRAQSHRFVARALRRLD